MSDTVPELTPGGRKHDAAPASDKQLTVRYTADLPKAAVHEAARRAHLAPATWARVVLAKELAAQSEKGS